jgi:hypothetical protein
MAARQGKPERAARQFGAVEGLSLAQDIPDWWYFPFQERLIATERAKLDRRALASAWEEGRAMTQEQAIPYALEEADPPERAQ